MPSHVYYGDGGATVPVPDRHTAGGGRQQVGPGAPHPSYRRTPLRPELLALRPGDVHRGVQLDGDITSVTLLTEKD
mgnify:CR=1 FL=1